MASPTLPTLLDRGAPESATIPLVRPPTADSAGLRTLGLIPPGWRAPGSPMLPLLCLRNCSTYPPQLFWLDAGVQIASLSMLYLLNDMSNEAAPVAIVVFSHPLSAYLNCLLIFFFC